MLCFAPGRKLLVLFRVSRNFSHGIKVLFPKKFAACCALPLEENYWYYSGSLESNLTSQKVLPLYKVCRILCFATPAKLLLLFRVSRNFSHGIKSFTSQKICCMLCFALATKLLVPFRVSKKYSHVTKSTTS